jgi:hypothetical protein
MIGTYTDQITVASRPDQEGIDAAELDVSSDERAKPRESTKTITHRKLRTANLAPDASRAAVSGGGGGQLDDERRAAFRTVDGPQRALVLLDDRV